MLTAMMDFPLRRLWYNFCFHDQSISSISQMCYNLLISGKNPNLGPWASIKVQVRLFNLNDLVWGIQWVWGKCHIIL